METKTYRDIDTKQAEINSLKQELEKKTKELQTKKHTRIILVLYGLDKQKKIIYGQ